MTAVIWRAPGAKRASKYGNTKSILNGETFDSRAEMARYQVLLALQQAGQISELTRQVSFTLAPAAIVAGKPKRRLDYRADFQYREAGSGRMVVEDVKGVITPIFRIKQHLMVTVHGIQISIIK